VIRRLLVASAIVLGSIGVFAGTSYASPIACAYNVNPLNIGLCLNSPT
jgi:energy-converting hydrogenase Eha subunit E